MHKCVMLTVFRDFLHGEMTVLLYRPYLHKGITINNCLNCLSNFAFAHSICLFHPPVNFVRKSLFKYGLVTLSALFQTSTQGKVRTFSALSTVLRTDGVRGLFAGNGANCLRVLPFSALVCLAYSNLARVRLL